MARPVRIEYEGALYYVTSRGNAGMDVFRSDGERELFLDILREVVEEMGWLCYGYCLMNDHYHLLVETPDANLGRGMRQLNGVFTQRINRQRGQGGHIFQGRYKAIVVDGDRFLLDLARHIVRNPLRVGAVSDISDWPWSSYRALAGLDRSAMMPGTEALLKRFGRGKEKAEQHYCEFVAADADVDIWRALNRQIYLGSDAFVVSVQKRAGLTGDERHLPKLQRVPGKSLAQFAAEFSERNAAIVAAYQSGCYSYSQIADYYGICFTTVGRIVRQAKVEHQARKRVAESASKQARPRKPKRVAEKGPGEDQRQLSLI